MSNRTHGDGVAPSFITLLWLFFTSWLNFNGRLRNYTGRYARRSAILNIAQMPEMQFQAACPRRFYFSYLRASLPTVLIARSLTKRRKGKSVMASEAGSEHSKETFLYSWLCRCSAENNHGGKWISQLLRKSQPHFDPLSHGWWNSSVISPPEFPSFPKWRERMFNEMMAKEKNNIFATFL